MLGTTTLLLAGNLMKTKENRKLSYKSLVFMSSLAGLIGVLAVPIWSRQREQDQMVTAKRYAEVLGYQVFEIYREATKNATEEAPEFRGPATADSAQAAAPYFHEAGNIGSDPWGQPYRYKLLSQSGDQMRVRIWSAGPNKLFETHDPTDARVESYIGDDVGVVLSMHSRPGE